MSLSVYQSYVCVSCSLAARTYTVYSLTHSFLLPPLASRLPPPPSFRLRLSPFSADSSMWTAGLRRHCKTFEREEGGFWMADDDIVRFFYSLTVCKVRCDVCCGTSLVTLARVLCARFVECCMCGCICVGYDWGGVIRTSTHRTHARLVLTTS